MFKIKTRLFIVLSCCLLALSACKKGDSPTGGTSAEGAAKLLFTINGIDNTEAIVDADAAGAEQMAAARNTPIRSTQLIGNQVIHGRENDMILDITGIGLQQDTLGISATSGSRAAGRQMVSVGGKQMLIATPMLSGGKYRVLIYDDAGATVAVIDGQAGTPITPVAVPLGKKYTWVAYTYNTTANMPALADNTNPAFNIDINSTMYVARGSINSTVEGNNSAPLTFKSVLAKVKVVIDGRGAFAPIGLTNGTLSMGIKRNSTGGLYNLKAGTMSNLNSAIDRGTIFPATQLSTVTKDSIITTTYTVLPGMVSLPDTVGFSLKNDYDNNYKPLVKSYNWVFKLAGGKTYLITMRLLAGINSGLGGNWAKTNLYMNPSNPGYRFRTADYMEHKYPETGQITGGEYWQYMQLSPLQNNADVTTAPLAYQGDPCDKVKPSGWWRLPTNSELATLVEYYNKPENTNTFYINAADAAWKLGTIAGYFNINGYVYLNGANVAKSPIGTGRYWGAATSDGQPSAIQINAPGITSETRRLFRIPDSQQPAATNPRNGNYVRCIRVWHFSTGNWEPQ